MACTGPRPDATRRPASSTLKTMNRHALRWRAGLDRWRSLACRTIDVEENMAQVFTELDDRLITFITSQPMFFVATAPCLDASGAGGHVNVSPKGYRDTFAVLDRLTVAYLDLTGSGAETIAHLRQNGKITIMFCSFDRTPKIVRIYGTGRAVLPADPAWGELASHFPGGDGDGT